MRTLLLQFRGTLCTFLQWDPCLEWGLQLSSARCSRARVCPYCHALWVLMRPCPCECRRSASSHESTALSHPPCPHGAQHRAVPPLVICTRESLREELACYIPSVSHTALRRLCPPAVTHSDSILNSIPLAVPSPQYIETTKSYNPSLVAHSLACSTLTNSPATDLSMD